MPTTFIFVAVVVVVAVVFLSMGADSDKHRRRALQTLAKLLGSSVDPLEGFENSFQIPFKYQTRECSYEDIEEKGFQGQVFRRGLLKMKTQVNLTVSFSEGEAGVVRDNVASLLDITNPWAQNVGKLIVPKSLDRFKIFTNNDRLATMLLTDEQALKVFERFKNVDSRGHPVMSLEIFDGALVLKFHAVGNLQPSLINFYGNVSTIEEFLTRLAGIGDKIEEIDKEIKAQSF